MSTPERHAGARTEAIMTRVLGVAIALVAAGCLRDPVFVPAQRATAPLADVEPSLTVRLDALAPDPRGMRVERVVVVLDGAPLYVRTGAQSEPRLIAAMQVAPGDHTLQMLLVASAPCGLLDEPRWSLELRSARSFVAGDRAVHLRIVPTVGRATAPPEELLGVRVVESRGGYVAPSAPNTLPDGAPTNVRYATAAGCPFETLGTRDE